MHMANKIYPLLLNKHAGQNSRQYRVDNIYEKLNSSIGWKHLEKSIVV